MREPRILLPLKRSEWRQPSQRSSLYAIENRTTFSIIGRLSDGHIGWRGVFEDRDDCDAFLYSLISGSLISEPPLWDLPVPSWRPDLLPMVYAVSVNRTITSTSGSNQNDTVPTDWGTPNTIELIASGGSGGAGSFGVAASGGGGGAYSSASNVILVPGASAAYHLEAGAPGTTVTNPGANGSNGGDCWYNGATLAASSVGAKGGNAGVIGTNPSGGAGGNKASGIGNTLNSGGRGGNISGGAANVATGGGGAGGRNGDGGNGTDTSTNNSATAGGNGDAGSGGAGSAGVFNGNSANGGNGTEFGSTGSGGGSGGASDNAGVARTTGTGGLYGAGGGGNESFTATSHTSGAGNQAIIFMTYEPFFPAVYLSKYPDRLWVTKRMVGY